MRDRTKNLGGRPKGYPASDAQKNELRRLWDAGRRVRSILSPAGAWEDDVRRADAIARLNEVLDDEA